jgi:hypothetical protein
MEVYRVKVGKKHYGTGKHVKVPNEPGKVLVREMPHLRIVPDHIWNKANEAIKARCKRRSTNKGPDHPLAGVPRDSRGPLSGQFFCGICGSKMYVDGRTEGGYRCSQTRKDGCWNRCTVLCSFAHAQIGQAIAGQLLKLDEVLDAYLLYVGEHILDDGSGAERKKQLDHEVQKLRSACNRLVDALEGDVDPPASLLERLHAREQELARALAELQYLETEEATPVTLPTREQILEKTHDIAGRLLAMDRETRVFLANGLITPIRAVPYLLFDSKMVVMRATFELRLAALLPHRILDLLNAENEGPEAARLFVVPMTVDLFHPSGVVKHHGEVMALRAAGLKLEEIAHQLGISQDMAREASIFGRKMKKAGITDPFTELKEAPKVVSRWRALSRTRNAQSVPASPNATSD